MTQHSPTPRIRVTLELDVPTFDAYEEQAIARGLMPETLLEERLHRCLNYTATQPLYFDDDQRRKLAETLGHNCNSVDVALAQIASVVKINVDDVEVVIPSRLKQRLQTRIFRGETYEQVVRREVIDALKRFCGML